MKITITERMYPKQVGVKIKTVEMEFEPRHPSTIYAIGPDHQEYFPCSIDSFGNVCDAGGIVVYPSGSGANPLDRGEHGYFGDFVENYAYIRPEEPTYPIDVSVLPSIRNAISLKSARKAAGLTQQELADRSGINVRQIQRIENGEDQIGSITLANAIKLADVLGVHVRDLI